jgi:hypothetical protein
MKKLKLILGLLLFAFVPSLTHAQFINGQSLGGATNLGSLSPLPDAGYKVCVWKTLGPNAICEVQTGQGAVNAITYSTTPVLALASGNIQQFTCTTASAAIVPTVTGLAAGKEVTVIFVQNGTTACTWTWPSNFHNATAVSATLGSVSTQQFVVSNAGTDAYAVAAGTACTTSCGTP